MKVIVCDDDHTMSLLLRKWTAEILEGQNYQFISYEDGEEILNRMKEYPDEEPVILFMDIQLKNRTGIDIARRLNSVNKNMAVIFITGFANYAEYSFEADPIYFLIKPLKWNSFEKAFRKALEKISKVEKESILIAQGRDMIRIFLDDIYYAESRGRKIVINLKDEIIEYYEKMDQLEKRLGDAFVRCHQSYLVNMRYVHSVEKNEIILTDGRRIMISKRKSNETKDQIFNYLKGTL